MATPPDGDARQPPRAVGVGRAPHRPREVGAARDRARLRALHDAVRERVDGRQRRLVVVGAGRARLRGIAREARDGRREHALHPRHGQVQVEVVAVGGVDVVAQPHARVGQHDLRARHARGDAPRQRPSARGERAPRAAAGPASSRRAASSAGRHELVVVVAGHDHDLLAGSRLAERGEHRRGELEHARRRVARAAPAGRRAARSGRRPRAPATSRSRTGGRSAMSVPDARAQVQVGDDRGQHRRRILTGAGSAYPAPRRVPLLPPQPLHRRLPDLLQGHRAGGPGPAHAAPRCGIGAARSKAAAQAGRARVLTART